MKKIIVYQKPTCTKCRQVIKELNKKGIEYKDINYYKMPFSENIFKELIKKMGVSPRDIIRTNEDIYKKLRIAKKEYSDIELIRFMIKYPDLIQRPIVVRGNKVVLARPLENLKKILPKNS